LRNGVAHPGSTLCLPRFFIIGPTNPSKVTDERQRMLRPRHVTTKNAFNEC
jgi:hypothetical protein